MTTGAVDGPVPGVVAVVVAYHAPDLLARCLEGLAGAVPVVVVDNSSDPAVRRAAEQHGARYVDPGANLGFAGGVTVGVGLAEGCDVLLVNPDAVIRGSRIWDGKWKEERAASNKIDSDNIEEFYRQRSMLKLSVLPEDIAEAVYFLASDKSGKSTGNVLNVDAGNATSFSR